MSALGDMQTTRHECDAVPLTWNMGWQEEEKAQDHARNWHPERCDTASRRCFFATTCHEVSALLQQLPKPRAGSSNTQQYLTPCHWKSSECGAPRVTTQHVGRAAMLRNQIYNIRLCREQVSLGLGGSRHYFSALLTLISTI